MDATTIVLLLITLVSAFVAIVWACKAERRIDEMRGFLDCRIKWFEDIRQRSIESRVEVGNHKADVASAKDVAHDARLIAKQVRGVIDQDHVVRESMLSRLSSIESRFGMLEKALCQEPKGIGKVIADEVLTLPDPTFPATAYVDGGHAATDEQPYPGQAAMEEMAEINQKAGLYDEPARDPRWNHGDPDPETAEAQPQPDDDQATAVNDVQAVVDWDEAKRGEVA